MIHVLAAAVRNIKTAIVKDNNLLREKEPSGRDIAALSRLLTVLPVKIR